MVVHVGDRLVQRLVLCESIQHVVHDKRMRTGLLLITSQYPSENWHDFFPDPTITDAVLDRVVHQAHRVQMKGESMRKVRGRAALATV